MNFLVIALVFTLIFTGCAKIKFTTGFSKNEFARCKNIKISKEIADVLLSEQKYLYENIFNNGVWEENIENMTMEEYAIDKVKNTITGLIYLSQISDDLQITFTDEETRKLNEAVEEYMSVDSSVSYDAIKEIYSLFLKSEKTFYALTDKVDTEVSNDEARIISVQYVFISTKTRDENGNIIDVSEAEHNKLKKQAKSLLEEINNGLDMISAAVDKSDDSIHSIELGRGQYNKSFEDAAFTLEIGETSDVVETEYGFYIIKCLNDNIENNIEKRKSDIVLNRRKELFAKEYESKIKSNDIQFNEKNIKKIDMKNIKPGNGKLIEIYKKYFTSTQSC